MNESFTTFSSPTTLKNAKKYLMSKNQSVIFEGDNEKVENAPFRPPKREKTGGNMQKITNDRLNESFTKPSSMFPDC